MRKLLSALTLISATFLTPGAFAQDANIDWTRCDQSNDLALAIKECTRIAAQTEAQGDTRGAAVANIYLGDAQTRARDNAAAIAAYTKSISIDNNIVESYNNRGLVYQTEDDHDKAIQDFNKAIEINPNSAPPYNNRGMSYGAEGQYDRAIADFTKAMSLAPNYVKGLINRGHSYVETGKLDNAIDDLTKAISMQPDASDAYLYRGMASSQKKNFTAAIQDFDKSISLDPQQALAFRERAVAYTQIDSGDQAISDLNKAIDLNPKDPLSFYLRGLFFMDTHQNAKSLSDLKTAKTLVPPGANTAELDAKIAQLESAGQSSSSQDSEATSRFTLLQVNKPIVSMGRCHMGECAWSKIVGTKVIGTKGDDVAVVAALEGGSSLDTKAGRKRVKWNGNLHGITLICSYSKPGVQIGEQTDYLPLNPDSGVPGVLEDSASLYFEVCHSDFNGPNLAGKYHYDVKAGEQ